MESQTCAPLTITVPSAGDRSELTDVARRPSCRKALRAPAECRAQSAVFVVVSSTGLQTAAALWVVSTRVVLALSGR